MLSKWHCMVDQKLRVFYTSIHPLLPILVRVTGGAGAYSSYHRARGRVRPGQIA